jgi:hypothetical protein
METLKNKDVLIYSDTDYPEAQNYRHMFNAPITLNLGEKKYILEAGNTDDITIMQKGIFLYIISQNPRHGYIALQVINTETDGEESVFLNEADVYDDESYSFGIMGMSPEKQLKLLLEYI